MHIILSDNINDSHTEEISLALQTISNINNYDKLIFDEDGIQIDKASLTQFVSRYINNRNRNDTISNLNKLVNNCDKLIHIKFKKIFMNPTKDNYSDENFLFYLHERFMIANFKNELSNAIVGLNNLVISYVSDENTINSINFIICKIKKIIDEIKNKLEKVKIEYGILKND